jgi:calcineurin-like phosphoesterase family protein
MTTITTKTWVISDLELDNEVLIRHKIRSSGYAEAIFKAWNSCVSSSDYVCLLGNVAEGRHSYWFSRIQELPGKKILFLGDKDRNRIKWYYKFGFEKVEPFGYCLLYRHEFGNIMLSHMPALSGVISPFSERHATAIQNLNKIFDYNSCILNIHGHTLGKGKETNKTFDCSVDVIGEQLVTIDQIIEHKFK